MLGILFAASALAAPRLELAGDVVVGAPIAVRVVVEPDTPVVVAGCGAVELERFDGAGWAPVEGPRCDQHVSAVVLDGPLSLPVVVPGAGRWRAVVAWGSGCLPDRPFSLARCRSLDVVRSEPFQAEG